MATQPIPQVPPPQDGPTRRTAMRRARTGGGFSSGVSTQSESLNAPANADDLEEPDLNSQVRDAVPRLPPPAAGAGDDGMDSRQRLFEAAMAGDASYARDMRLGLLNRLLMRGVAHAAIARELGVSLSTIREDVRELRRRMRERAQGLNINELIGEQMAFYDEAVAVSLRVVSQQDMPTPMRLAGVRTALAAKADQTRFLTNAGVFDVLQFRRMEDGTDLSDVQMLMQRTEEALERLSAEDSAPPPSAPSRPVIVRRNRPGGFSGMSFDDRAASGSSEEIVEL